MAGGASKFDVLPTRIRFGSSTAPGWMNGANEVGIGLGNATVALHMTRGGVLRRNVPTCEMADAPGIFTAMTRARMLLIGCARAVCHIASPCATVIPVAKAIMLGKLAVNVRMFVGLWTSDAKEAPVLAINCGSCWVTFPFARLSNTLVDR